jgi:hypothetical protein
MYEHCPVCDLKFEREEGYFLGAMYISYGMALCIIGFFTFLLWSITRLTILSDVVWAVALFVPLAPAVTLLARIVWMYLDQTIDPDSSE